MNEGGVILYPTDTVWGIGCDATNEEAVRRVYEIKKRADSKAMLVLVDSPVKVDFYVQDVPAVAWDLIEVADKPLTIIYSGARNLATNLLAEDGSVGTKGNVLDAMKAEGVAGDVIYSCGPTPMLKALKNYAEGEGIEAQISLEEKMACGIGACLACVCQSTEVDHHSNVHNKRICKDGPVFDAREVDL